MLLVLGFAFLAGIVTILSPCVLPVLPVVLSGGISGGKQRPFGIVIGFTVSFTFFTLFLTAIVRATGISPDILRAFSVVTIIIFGLSLLVPKLQIFFEQLSSKLVGLAPTNNQREDFLGGILIGISLGLIWTPCVGPILASVISLALTGTVTGTAFLITLAYSLGTAIPMFAVIWGGRQLLQKNPWLLTNSTKIQKAFGVFMIITALAIATNLDRKFQVYVLEKFPNYGLGLTQFEDNDIVKNYLNPMPEEKRGKPMFDMLDNLGNAPELISGGQWFNTKPLTLSEVRGKVVLVDFWTYTCINCIRTLPFVKNWHSKYKDSGLVIIGVHTPEFEFEKDPKNVAGAIKDFGLEYPVMQDNNYATWQAYANHYWPAKYLIDTEGKIRYTHFGEGGYDETEKAIQELLGQTGPIDNRKYSIQTRTPELYLGYLRISNFSSKEGIKNDIAALYSIPASIPANTFAYGGTWTVGDERAMPTKGASLLLHFDAKDVYLVMRPKAGATGKLKVFLDGVENLEVTVDSDKLYELIKLPSPGDHLLKLDFLDNNLELYAFTFG